MACPYFMPEERLDSTWPFPQRLPLGRGWAGVCMAPGHEHEHPCGEELTSSCNLGYAKSCSRMPADRRADAVRFCLGEERDGVLHVRFVCELAYLPAGDGELLYDKRSATWIEKHADACLQRMAECYVRAQMERRIVEPGNEKPRPRS